MHIIYMLYTIFNFCHILQMKPPNYWQYYSVNTVRVSNVFFAYEGA